MHLRTITIWTTGLMLIGTVVLPALFVFNVLQHTDLPAAFRLCSQLCLISGLPSAISFMLAIILKRSSCALVLLSSTIAFIPLFFYSYWRALEGGASMFWILTPSASLPWMIFSWGVAIMLYWHYLQKTIIPSGYETKTNTNHLEKR